jgi:Tfp pilus assembly protein FimT
MAIMGILAAVVVPNLAGSVRGNRIRQATRTVITSTRYARNMSILRETDHALVFDLDASAVYLSGGAVAIPTNVVDAAATNSTESVLDGKEEDAVIFESDRAFAGDGEFSRKLEGVTIESVEVNGAEVYKKGRAAVIFESNGRCTPYVVTLTDETGKLVIIDVDSLAATETRVIE